MSGTARASFNSRFANPMRRLSTSRQPTISEVTPRPRFVPITQGARTGGVSRPAVLSASPRPMVAVELCKITASAATAIATIHG